ncbi:MAG: ABC transporter ATP-binding protein [Clostridia bacterium]|nr:ABC transporter ATP-binding protein [Clostridia bacterium]MBQ8971499.1 ABC transporter ATP-binding protein [Clostridia bacterium]
MKRQGTLRSVLRRIGRYRYLVFISFALSAVVVALTLYAPYLAGEAIDQIAVTGFTMEALSPILVRLMLCVALTALLQWVMNAINNRVTFQVVRDLRQEALRKIGSLPLAYIDSHPHGELVSRVITDADQFADGLLMGFTQLFAGIITILGTLAILFARNWQIALVVVLVTPLSLFVARFIATKTHDMFVQQSRTRGEMTAYIDEMIGNAKVVKAYGRESQSLHEFDDINDRLGKIGMRATFFSSLTNPSTRFVNSMVYAGVALTGALSVLRGGMTVGLLTSFLSYANQYTKPFNEISGVVTELQNAIACAARLLELIHEPSQTPEPSNAVELKDVKGSVTLENVDFSYTPEKALIQNFNLSVQPGQRVAIVGPTGCGKTTLINLLMRFYDVDAGSVRVEGHDVRQTTRRSLRGAYGMVLQETWLKAGTIRENIAMGKPEATEEEIIAAAKASHAHSFIRRLPQGYDTVIGEDGGMLSQGQKQLLCITRVMLCLPPMLILDEATSSIDTRTELKIQSAFARMMEGRTSFIVAHRLSTIRNADVILVMRDGHIVEQGDHESLLAQNGFYAELYYAAQ